MQKIFFLVPILLIMWGCSASIDTSNMTSEERLAYSIRMYENEDYDEAITELQALILQYPGSAIIDDAQYYLAMCRFKREEYILAAFEFSKLIKNMAASEYLPESQFMLAECYYMLSPNVNLDQSYSKKAIEEYQAFIDFFPLNEKVLEAENKIKELYSKLAEKEFNAARIYEKMGYYTASLKYYDEVMELYHDTEYAPLALYYKIFLLEERNQNDKALDEAKKFIEKYPDHSNSSSVRSFINGLEKNISVSK